MLNHCVLTGNLGGDPEIRYTTNGDPVATLNLAFRFGKNETGWIKVTCFKKLAELCEKYLHKGARVGIDGYLVHESWETQSNEKANYDQDHCQLTGIHQNRRTWLSRKVKTPTIYRFSQLKQQKGT